MKMQEVVEAARKASPAINEAIAYARELVSGYAQLLEDLNAVKSESGRKSIVEQCLLSVGAIKAALGMVEAPWKDFSTVLHSYSRVFKGGGRVVRDAPGQLELPLEELVIPGLALEGGLVSGLVRVDSDMINCVSSQEAVKQESGAICDIARPEAEAAPANPAPKRRSRRASRPQAETAAPAERPCEADGAADGVVVAMPEDGSTAD